ncbi:hypothetical protein EDB80DRAFT_833445 [Ilyonectria destructans]|nr:hypothetical protein EDB80DRAFT_833445 [Ilyonectria destructans]
MSLERLPNEICFMIIKACNTSTRAALILTCSRFYELGNRILFEDDAKSATPKAVFRICSRYTDARAAVAALGTARQAGANVKAYRPATCWSLIGGNCTKTWVAPIHIAAARGQDAVVEYLLASGVPIDPTKHSSRPPLFAAIYGRQFNTAKFLIQNHASLFFDGYTALHAAAHSGLVELVDFLVNEMKFDVNTTDKQGRTPMEYALWSHQDTWERMIPRLKGLGAILLYNHIFVAIEARKIDELKLLTDHLVPPHQPLLTGATPNRSEVPGLGIAIRRLQNWRPDRCRQLCHLIFSMGYFELLPVDLWIGEYLSPSALGDLETRAKEILTGKACQAFDRQPNLLQQFQVAKKINRGWASSPIPSSLGKLVDELGRRGFTVDKAGFYKMMYQMPIYFE